MLAIATIRSNLIIGDISQRSIGLVDQIYPFGAAPNEHPPTRLVPSDLPAERPNDRSAAILPRTIADTMVEHVGVDPRAHTTGIDHPSRGRFVSPVSKISAPTRATMAGVEFATDR